MAAIKWADLTPRERDALVAERVMGACLHDFDTATADAYYLNEARESFTEDYGVAPPATWRPYDWDEDWRAECRKCGRRWNVYTGNSLRPRADQDVRRYTTDIAAAWEVVEKMRSDAPIEMWDTDGPASDGGFWSVSIEGRHGWVTGEAPTASEAICIAALRAVDRGAV